MLDILGLCLLGVYWGVSKDAESMSSMQEDLRPRGKYWNFYTLLRQSGTLVVLIVGRDLRVF
jgi:uncharacterized protein (DUF849 family)